MVLQAEELQRLKQLAHLSFTPDEEEKFLVKLQSVITELERLSVADFPEVSVESTMMQPLQSGQEQTIDILANVQHLVINSSIVVKSVLE